MKEHIDNEEQRNNLGSNTSTEKKGKQEQTDPQITELRGFVDSKEDLEPTLTDGTKAPDKAKEENRNNNQP